MKSKTPHILVSLESRHAENIFLGSKQVELRRRSMKIEPGSIMWIYEKLPVGKVTGYVIVDSVEQGSPIRLWRKFGSVSGLSRQEFFKYYEGREQATVLHLSDPALLTTSITLKQLRVVFRSFQPPQFFSRLNSSNPVLHELSAAM